MAKMQSVWRLTLFLCCVWVATLFYGEMVAFWVPLWSCSWPQLKLMPSAGNQMKVAVLADPQLTDRTSHGLAPKSLALEAIQFYTDLYMRRSFRTSILPFKPHAILFLGDHFDGGPYLSDEEWEESLSRFKHIFGLNQGDQESDIQVLYLSGNHDIGYSGLHSRYPKVISRYDKEFGARNNRFTVGKVEFIAVDAQTLDGSLQGNLTSSSWDFVKNISMDVMLLPRVLLTHIPLYRPNGTTCGPYRSSPIINQRISRAGPDQGITYQNYLSAETSEHLLNMIKPILVLSGHDHDQCTVTHLRPGGLVNEHTLGTLSWQQGNLYPSFMLLSVNAQANPNATNDLEGAVSTYLCFLPMQTHIYIWYLSLFVATFLLLLLWPANGFGSWNWYDHFVAFIGRAMGSLLKGGNKEKDEDENCEYEMIWDAEGSMHLVKKPMKKIPSMVTSDSAPTGRGNLAVRATAKKHTVQETEASFAVELNTDMRTDGTGRGHRVNKSKTRIVVQRLVRMFRLLIVIAAVNVPLYIILLFKDWIDQ